METIFLLPIKILVSVIAALVGYRFIRWVVSVLTLGKGVPLFDRIKNKYALAEIGQLIIFVLFIVGLWLTFGAKS